MLAGCDLDLFSEACRELYKPGLTLENYPRRCFAFLEKLVPAEFIAFGSLDTSAQSLDIGFNHAVPNFVRAMEAFGSIMGRYDLYRFDPTVNDGKPFCRSDYYSSRQFRDLDIFGEVYSLLGIDNHCAVYVPTGPEEIAFFGIERDGGPDFSGRDRGLLELAQSHLGNARALVRERIREGDKGASPVHLAGVGLTNREADVLAWIAEGKSNEEIAILLGLKLYTVKGYVKSIFQKIGVPNRLSAALWALRTSRREEARVSMDDLASVRVHSTGGRRRTIAM